MKAAKRERSDLRVCRNDPKNSSQAVLAVEGEQLVSTRGTTRFTKASGLRPPLAEVAKSSSMSRRTDSSFSTVASGGPRSIRRTIAENKEPPELAVQAVQGVQAVKGRTTRTGENHRKKKGKQEKDEKAETASELAELADQLD